MEVFKPPEDYLYNLHTCSPGERDVYGKTRLKNHSTISVRIVDLEKSLTLDHVVPRFHGGTDETKNLICACAECNRDKSHEDWRPWYTRQGFYDPYKEARIIEWQKQNTANFSNYIETKRAGMILTRNNFVYKKLKKS